MYECKLNKKQNDINVYDDIFDKENYKINYDDKLLTLMTNNNKNKV